MKRSASMRRRRYNRVLRWLRRIHMYLGLFMFPWILVYAITALFFNHATFLPDYEIRRVRTEDLEGTALAALPAPDEIAQHVVQRLERDDRERPNDLRLVHPERARYLNVAGFNTARNGKRYELLFFPSKSSGRVNIRSAQQERRTPLGRTYRLDLDRSTRQELQRGAVEVFRKLGIDTEEARLRFGPLLEFEIESGGQPWRLRYNLGNGNINAVPRGGWPGFRSAREYLIRLHVTHAYPPEPGRRTFWAFFVDLVAVAMILWVLTGLLMWWQMKVVRWTGGIVVAVSTLWAFGLGYLMYDFFRYLP